MGHLEPFHDRGEQRYVSYWISLLWVFNIWSYSGPCYELIIGQIIIVFSIGNIIIRMVDFSHLKVCLVHLLTVLRLTVLRKLGSMRVSRKNFTSTFRLCLLKPCSLKLLQQISVYMICNLCCGLNRRDYLHSLHWV